MFLEGIFFGESGNVNLVEKQWNAGLGPSVHCVETKCEASGLRMLHNSETEIHDLCEKAKRVGRRRLRRLRM